jgi:hypothetical protein
MTLLGITASRRSSCALSRSRRNTIHDSRKPHAGTARPRPALLVKATKSSLSWYPSRSRVRTTAAAVLGCAVVSTATSHAVVAGSMLGGSDAEMTNEATASARYADQSPFKRSRTAPDHPTENHDGMLSGVTAIMP